MKLKEIIIYLLTAAINTVISLILNAIIFDSNSGTFVFVVCGTILLALITTKIVAHKMNYKLDIFAYDIKDQKYLTINSVFIGCLFTVPIALIIGLIL